MVAGNLLKAVMSTALLMGTEFDEDAAKMFVSDLAMYPEDQILASLQRCRREVRGRLTVADVVSRIDDGRPGPDEAWAMLPRNEQETVVWTAEMRQAWDASRHAEGPAARAAFTERYKALVADSRSAGKEPAWEISEGWDAAGRQLAVRDAIAKGRLPAHMADLYPQIEQKPRLPIGWRRLDSPSIAPGLTHSAESPPPLPPATPEAK